MLRLLLVATMLVSKKGKYIMKTVMNIIGAFMIFFGLMMIAGSGNDCDGKCMEQANTLGEMLMVALTGLFFAGCGAFICYKGRTNDQ